MKDVNVISYDLYKKANRLAAPGFSPHPGRLFAVALIYGQ